MIKKSKVLMNEVAAINASTAVRFNCMTVLYALQSFQAMSDKATELKTIRNRGEFWGRVQLSFRDQIVITTQKIFEKSDTYPQETFRELSEYATSRQIAFQDISDSEKEFIERVKQYRNKFVAHHERMENEQFISLVGDDFWSRAIVEIPKLMDKALSLCVSICAVYGIALETRPVHCGYKDTVRWMNLDQNKN